METLLNSGLVGNIGLKNLQEQRSLIVERWEQTELLDGLSGSAKENIAQLFENQASYMLNESTVSDSSGSFETVAFPIVRRVFQKLLANEIVSIQAMSAPIGRLYFFNPKVSTRNLSDHSHESMDGGYSNAATNYQIDAATGKKTILSGDNFNKTGGTKYSSTSLYDSFYATEYNDEGTALFDLTRGKIFIKNIAATPKVGAYANGTMEKFQVKLTGFTATRDGRLVGPTGTPSDTEEFLSSLKITCNQNLFNGPSSIYYSAGTALDFRTLAQAYAKPLVKNGTIELEIDTTAPSLTSGLFIPLTASTGTSATLTGATPTFTASYSVYSDLEEDSEMAEVTFDLDFITVDVSSRKLRTNFTPEIQQDAAAFHNIDVEAELTAMLSETISAEIDREILRDLRKGAAWATSWDYAGYRKLVAEGKSVGITQKDYNQELITKVNEISALIMKTTLRGGANFVVVSPEIAAVLNNLEYFHVTDASPEETKFSMGIEKIGSIQGRYTVYVDMYAPAGKMLVGHKGEGIFHAGFIYAPYVPLMLFPAVVNPNNFSKVLGIMTRYAKKMVNNRFYGVINVKGLNYTPIAEFLGA
jgi:hypothetical protein